MAAGERGHERRGIVVPAQRQRGQLQPGRPAFGPGRQRRHRRIGQGRRRVLEQLGCLRGREPQNGLAYLGQLAAGPQPRQRQRRVAAAGQHHAHPGRPVLDQERERLVHLLRADQVIIVEDKHDLVRGQIVDQRRTRPPNDDGAGSRAAGCRSPSPAGLGQRQPPRVRQKRGRVGCRPRPATASRPARPRRSPVAPAGPAAVTGRAPPGTRPRQSLHPRTTAAAAADRLRPRARACQPRSKPDITAPASSPTSQPSLTCPFTPPHPRPA